MTLRPGRGNIFGQDESAVLDKPRVSVYRAAAGNVAAATVTAIPWDSIEYDTDGMYTVGSTSLVIRTAGLWRITGWGALANAGDTSYRQIYFTKAGANAYGQVTGTLNGLQWAACSSVDIPLRAGDTMQMVWAQGSAGPLAFSPATLTSRLNGFQACLVSTI